MYPYVLRQLEEFIFMAKLSVTQNHIQYLDNISLLNDSVTNTLYRVLEEHKKANPHHCTITK